MMMGFVCRWFWQHSRYIQFLQLLLILVLCRIEISSPWSQRSRCSHKRKLELVSYHLSSRLTESVFETDHELCASDARVHSSLFDCHYDNQGSSTRSRPLQQDEFSPMLTCTTFVTVHLRAHWLAATICINLFSTRLSFPYQRLLCLKKLQRLPLLPLFTLKFCMFTFVWKDMWIYLRFCRRLDSSHPFAAFCVLSPDFWAPATGISVFVYIFFWSRCTQMVLWHSWRRDALCRKFHSYGWVRGCSLLLMKSLFHWNC